MLKVLVVSYDLSVLASAKRMLQDNFHVLTADDGETAVSLLADFSKVGAVVCDTKASNMSGPEFLEAAAKVVPDATFVLMVDPTTDVRPQRMDGRSPFWHCVEKPVDARTILALLDGQISGADKPPGHGFSSNSDDENVRDALSKTDPDVQFNMLYQPRICTASGRVCAVEALVRWENPALGAIPPATFIPVAEQSGDIAWITDWTLQTACNAVRDWTDQGCPAIPVSVNISPMGYTDPRFIGLVANAIRVAGIPANRLELEVTAGLSLCGNKKASATAAALRDLGVRVNIDSVVDQGLPDSTLTVENQACLQRGDKFIRRVTGKDPVSTLQAMLKLGAKMGIKTVAAGVETLQHAEFIRKLGFDQMQGFHISRPLAQGDLAHWIQSRASA
ncbi:EAL domain-containing protein [Hwanghaeella grinnelliae]|nr:EAL domain-containing protein [Hwanghaeella grinnelliae]